ncbi:zf-HC2 domain-containing protein [Altererythrobacter sp.]|nr:zf-HC2 domain-containing protein [Altererythrobacter sp.]
MALLSSRLRLKIKALIFRLPGMITCAEFDRFIVDYFEGELSDAELRTFERHMAVCRECREYLAAYRASMALVRDASAQATDVDLTDPPEDLIAAIVAARNRNKNGLS